MNKAFAIYWRQHWSVLSSNHIALIKIVSSINIVFNLLMTALIYQLPSCIDHLLSTEDIHVALTICYLLKRAQSICILLKTALIINLLKIPLFNLLKIHKNSTDHLQSTKDTTGHMPYTVNSTDQMILSIEYGNRISYLLKISVNLLEVIWWHHQIFIYSLTIITMKSLI